MDAGEIAEFDEPLKLYDQEGIFRGMCEQSAISREEIIRARVVNID
jgi:ATP-binding cassette subfamily C (CFTR/MRP) protein 1